MMGGGMLGLGLVGFLVTLVIIIVVVGGLALLAVWLVRQSGSGIRQGFIPAQVKPVDPPTPREILQARYARGELTQEQYQQILSDIG
jgi:putative membrane protein